MIQNVSSSNDICHEFGLLGLNGIVSRMLYMPVRLYLTVIICTIQKNLVWM